MADELLKGLTKFEITTDRAQMNSQIDKAGSEVFDTMLSQVMKNDKVKDVLKTGAFLTHGSALQEGLQGISEFCAAGKETTEEAKLAHYALAEEHLRTAHNRAMLGDPLSIGIVNTAVDEALGMTLAREGKFSEAEQLYLSRVISDRALGSNLLTFMDLNGLESIYGAQPDKKLEHALVVKELEHIQAEGLKSPFLERLEVLKALTEMKEDKNGKEDQIEQKPTDNDELHKDRLMEI